MLLLLLVLFIIGLICTTSISTRNKLSAWCNQIFLHKETSNNLKSKTDNELINNCHTSNKVDLKLVFATFDKNRDGFITKEELQESLMSIGISATEKDVADMVEKVDSNGDGLIDLAEFRQLFEFKSRSDEEDEEEEERDIEDWKEAFDIFDENKDGVITVEELGFVLSSLGFTEGNKLEYCKAMINKVDIDGDGMIDFVEFKKMMKNGGLRLVPLSKAARSTGQD